MEWQSTQRIVASIWNANSLNFVIILISKFGMKMIEQMTKMGQIIQHWQFLTDGWTFSSKGIAVPAASLQEIIVTGARDAL